MCSNSEGEGEEKHKAGRKSSEGQESFSRDCFGARGTPNRRDWVCEKSFHFAT